MEWLRQSFFYYKLALPVGIPMYLEDLKWTWNVYVNNLTALGIYLTISYVAFMVNTVSLEGATDWIVKKANNNDLNEIGDFLAGIFGPIAFGWLIIGYLMQNIELKNGVVEANSTNKLNKNQFEFNKLIKEYEISREHNDKQPIFAITTSILSQNKIEDDVETELNIEIFNHGYIALNVYVSRLFKPNEKKSDRFGQTQLDVIKNGESNKVTFKALKKDFIPKDDDDDEKNIAGIFFIEFVDGIYITQTIEVKLFNLREKKQDYFYVEFLNSTRTLPNIFSHNLENL